MTTTVADVRDIDLFTDENLTNPYPLYRQLRDAGPAVFLNRVGCWAVPRYADVRASLDDWKTFTSAQGVGMNDEVNGQLVGTVLASDPPLHDTLRSVLADRLSPRALRDLTDSIRQQAETLVEDVVGRGTFDVVNDLARVFPVSVVGGVGGGAPPTRPRLLDWGDGIFNALGPANSRGETGIPLVQEQFGWLYQLNPKDLFEGSMGRAIYEAADEGLIEPASAPALLAAYTSASMDTTVNAIGSAVMLFAQHPDQWEALRADRSLMPGAFNEVLRYESPLQMFSRVTNADVNLDDTVIPAGSRVLMMYGSANRDERHYGDSADRFDITRDSADHLSFGLGLHGCAGQGLARLEAHSILSALADRVVRFEPKQEPERHLNNCVRGLEAFPVTVQRG